MIKKELLKGLTDEQIKKVENCKTTEEVLAFAKKEGVELTDEQLAAVSGGCDDSNEKSTTNCPACGSSNIHVSKETHQGEDVCECYCYDCDFYWTA